MALGLAIAQIDSLLANLQANGEPTSTDKGSHGPPVPATEAAPGTSISSKRDKKAGKASKQKPAEDIKAKAKPEPVSEDPVCKALFQVAKVCVVEEFESDKLYCCQVALADGTTRQVIAGLKKHVARADLEGRMVCLIVNLKPAKLAGKLSEAMILCGVHAQPDGSELVHPIQPPAGCSPGDAIFAEGLQSGTPPPKTLKSDLWRGIAAELKADKGFASYRGNLLRTSAGSVTVHASIPDGSPIR